MLELEQFKQGGESLCLSLRIPWEDGPVSETDEEVQTKQEWLCQWGYADPERGYTTPFQTMVSGLLCWSHDPGDASFMARARERAEGLLIPVEPLYAAATFGLLALDMFTTTGLRLNELMQARVSKDCLVRQVDNPPPGAKDRSVRVRYLFRLIPKGEKTETPRNYFIPTGCATRLYLSNNVT